MSSESWVQQVGEYEAMVKRHNTSAKAKKQAEYAALVREMKAKNARVSEPDKLIWYGYACALISLGFAPPAFAIAAFVIGIVNIINGRAGHGVAQILLAWVCGTIGTLLSLLFAAALMATSV